MKLSILLLALLLLTPLTWAQRAGYTPPSARPQADPARPPSAQTEFEVAKAQMDKRASSSIQRMQSAELAKLRQDADDLATLAQSIPPDVDQTTKGILPKDLDQRLKKIEKLAKELRARLSH